MYAAAGHAAGCSWVSPAADHAAGGAAGDENKAEEPAKEAEGEEEKKEGGEEEKGRSSRKRNRGGGGNNVGASIDSLAEAAVRKLSAVEPKLELAGQQLQFLAHREQVYCPLQHPTPIVVETFMSSW